MNVKIFAVNEYQGQKLCHRKVKRRQLVEKKSKKFFTYRHSDRNVSWSGSGHVGSSDMVAVAASSSLEISSGAREETTNFTRLRTKPRVRCTEETAYRPARRNRCGRQRSVGTNDGERASVYRRSRPTRRSQRLSAISGAGRGRRPFILTRRRWRQRLRRRRRRRCLNLGFLAGVVEEATSRGRWS